MPDPKTIDELDAAIDKMEGDIAAGETPGEVSGPSNDDVEVIYAPEDEALPEKRGEEGEAGETPTEEDERGEEKELAGYSQKVRQRIERETRLRKDSEAREEAERSARVAAERRAQASDLSHRKSRWP